MTKFLIIGDLHGNKPIISTNEFDAIIAPGDFCSDELRKYMFQALKERIENPKSKSRWWNIIKEDEAKKMVDKSLKDGREILEFLNSFNKPVFALPGNWDWTGDREWSYIRKNNWKNYLVKNLKNIKDCHKKIRNFEDLTIIGHGITSGPEYPQHESEIKKLTKSKLAKKKKKYDKLYDKVDKLFKKSTKPIIFLTHNVPFNTKLDEITDQKSPRSGMHFGSILARELIEKYQPLVSIGGHMHEHHGKDKIGKTVVINAGFGSYVNTILEIKDNKITNLEFIKIKN